MGRTVVTAADIAKENVGPADLESVGGTAEAAKKKPDDYKDRLLKYIPAEVVALYVFLTGIVANVEATDFPLSKTLWVVFIFCLVATPLYLRGVAGVPKWQQILISTGAFAVWAFSLGGPFDGVVEHWQVYGSLALPMYTFLIPMVEARS